MKPLERRFFDRSAVEVASDLLGCVISHETAEGLVAAVIVETEAYTGLDDPASHAYRGKTERNAVMFGEPGHVYVYFTYGMHFCVNLVCQPAGIAAAVLLRAGRVIEGQDLAAERRRNFGGPVPGDAVPGGSERRAAALGSRSLAGRSGADRDLARGPARLCQALAIDRGLNGADVCDPGSPVLVGQADSASIYAAELDIRTGPRVGVSQGADVQWRFWLAGEPAVSNYRPHTPRRRRPTKPV